MKKQRIFADFGLNIIASGILNFVLQLVIYPFFAGHNSTGEYGTIVTIMGIANILIATLGNSLNNTRLIQNRKYTEGNHTGDFNLLAVTSAFASLLITYCINFIFALDLRTSLALILYTFFGVLRAYYIVVYRLVLDFKRLLYCNLVICGGYFVGLLLAYHAKCWPIAFAFGEITGCIYLFLTTSIIKENYKRTPLLKATISKYFILIGTTLIGNLILYMDRLIIYPVLGADSVAIYTTASVFGKSFGVVMIPIAGVLLGYYAQKDFHMTVKRFHNINITVLLLSGAFYLFAYFVAPWFTKLLYPTLIQAALPYIILANLAAILNVTGNMIQPAVLQYAPTYWQVVIQILYGAVYIGGGYAALTLYGLWGFCIAAIIANIIRVIVLYIVGNKSIKKQEVFT